MNKFNRRNEGFIKALTVFVFGIGLLFIFFAFFAKNFQFPANTNMIASTNTNSKTSGNSSISNPIDTQTNSMLSFLDTNTTSYGSDARSTSVNKAGTSPYNGKISLSSGNASYSNQPFDEYITIRNSSAQPINITGWTLTNGKGTRPIQNSENSYVYPTADSAIIGQGTEFLDPSGVFDVGPIILATNDIAYVITGRPFSQYPFSLYTSFRENICTGYLRNYPFNPSLYSACPYPANDPAIQTVTDECYNYMTRLNRCEDPEKEDKTNFDMQTSPCKNFMTARLNYGGCVANNKSSPNFYLSQWRIFLGKPREMWASQRETITLYDTNNLIVDQISY